MYYRVYGWNIESRRTQVEARRLLADDKSLLYLFSLSQRSIHTNTRTYVLENFAINTRTSSQLRHTYTCNTHDHMSRSTEQISGGSFCSVKSETRIIDTSVSQTVCCWFDLPSLSLLFVVCFIFSVFSVPFIFRILCVRECFRPHIQMAPILQRVLLYKRNTIFAHHTPI